MSDPRIRIRRLSRLALRARATVAEAERGLATAAREAAGAAVRSASLAQFIAETAPAPGDGHSATLLAGAHLRQLLRPAAEAASAQRAQALLEQADAERRLGQAAARADGLADRLAEARRAAAREAERRTADMTPMGRSRK
jgi:hypothetical protein